MKYLVANWKAHKSLSDVESWLQVFKKEYQPKDDVVVGIAASFPHLSYVADQIKDLKNCVVVAQSVSAEPQGSYTGEVSAQALQGIASYCIVGHSQRRKMGESSEQVLAHVIHLKEKNITPILCIRGIEDFPEGYAGIVAYEQPEKIGTGHGTAVDHVMEVYRQLALASESTFLYGASVDEHNCKDYLVHPEIAGFIVGTASLQPAQFMKIAENI